MHIKRYLRLILVFIALQALLYGMAITATIPQIVTTYIQSAMVALAAAYNCYQTPRIVEKIAHVASTTATEPSKATQEHIPAHQQHLQASHYTLNPQFITPQAEQSGFSFSLLSVLPNNAITENLREQRLVTEEQLRIKNMHIIKLIERYPQVQQGYRAHLDTLAHLIIDIHNPNEKISQKSRNALILQEPFYGPHYYGFKNALFALLPTFCAQDGALCLQQKVENAHLDVAKALRDLFINDQKSYLHYLEIASQKEIPGMEKIFWAELEKTGSTGFARSWSTVSKIFWFNKDNLCDKARNNPFNKDLHMVAQLAEQGRIFEAEKLFQQHASIQMWMENPEKHAQLYQYFFSLSDQIDITYGIFKKYQQDPLWAKYPDKEILCKDFLEYKQQKRAYPESVAQVQALFKARHELKESCIKTYELTDFLHEPQINEVLYRLVDRGSDAQKQLQFLYYIFNNPQNRHHATVKKLFFTDKDVLKIAEKNKSWAHVAQNAQRISSEQFKQEHAHSAIDLFKQGKLQEASTLIVDKNEARYTVVAAWLTGSKISTDCPPYVRDFLYNLMDSASDITGCIEGFNKLLLNAHHPQDAALASYFFNEEGILRMYEDDLHARNFKINKALSWPVQRQITEYANKLLSLKTAETIPLFIFEQLERAWGYIDAASQSSNDNQALVYAYIADGIFQALQGSEFHEALFNLPYLFDYHPDSYEYAVNVQQFQKIAQLLSVHETQKNNLLFNEHGGDYPEPPQQPQQPHNGGPNQPPGPGSPLWPGPNPHNNKGHGPELMLPAAVAKELCNHHEIIDETELALVHWFNRLDVAIKNNIRLANNFFTHIRYGSWNDKLQQLSGGHTFDAKCCMRFEHVRTLVGGHGEHVVRWFHNGVGKQSSIFIDFNSRRFIEHLVKVLESGKFEVTRITAPKVITYLSDCGVPYILQSDNSKIFNTAFPSTNFIFSAAADMLPKCVQNCLS